MKNNINKLFKGCMVFASLTMLGSCDESFLKQDPLSFYEPKTTYATEGGLQAALAMCDLHYKELFCIHEVTEQKLELRKHLESFQYYHQLLS